MRDLILIPGDRTVYRSQLLSGMDYGRGGSLVVLR